MSLVPIQEIIDALRTELEAKMKAERNYHLEPDVKWDDPKRDVDDEC